MRGLFPAHGHASRQQAPPVAEWELIVVDNQSHDFLATSLNLLWHPRGRIGREKIPRASRRHINGSTPHNAL